MSVTMDDDIGLLSSASSVTSVTCSGSINSKSKHSQQVACESSSSSKRLHSAGSFMRRSSSPSLISSSSRNDENHMMMNRTSINNDSVSSSNSSVFIDEKMQGHNKLEPNKLIKSLHQHRTSYSEDYDNELNSICNMAKVKVSKQQEVGFLNLLQECQTWIETVSNTKFAYPNDFRKSLENGVILCELLNVLKKDCVRRINRHSTTIAGIDNLNVFLKACQEHFHLIQSNLFDIIDLEDLHRRRGDELTSPTSCFSPYDSKDSSVLSTAISTEKLNAFNSNPNANDYLADEEQKRRLKKVINTIHWLSRKAFEIGIQLPYHFDISNPLANGHHSIKSAHNNPKSTLGCSYNSVSSSTSSTSSSSSYCSSFSNSSLNQYSTSSSLSSASSLSVIASNSSGNLPPQTPLTGAKVSSTPKASFNCSQAAFVNNIPKKRHSIQPNSFKNLDEIDLSRQASNIDEINKPFLNNNSNQQNYKMSYIYKQPSNLSGTKLSNKVMSTSLQMGALQIDPSSSSASSTSSEYTNNKSSSSLSPTAHNAPALVNDQDEVQLIDSTMSPISSTNSAAVSPRVNLSTSSSSTNVSNLNLNNQSTTVIPTRYIDRRLSCTPVEQKFNLNYSEAGQRLARKAEDTLKNVEKSKEKQKQFVQSQFLNGNSNVTSVKNGPSLLQAALAYNKKNLVDQMPVRPKPSGSGGGAAGEDWQNSVDDWKKRRREKKNLPAPRSSQFIEFDEDEHQRTERKRINRFENSSHYLSPPRTIISPDPTDQSKPQPETSTPGLQSSTSSRANTIEISGINPPSQPVPTQTTEDDSNLNESLTNEEEDSLICTDFKYTFIEKFVEIERPYDHKSRGFGFLLNCGLQNSNSESLKKLQDDNINKILSKNYAQIVMVENGSLASTAGLIEGDLVTLINEAPTGGLTNEQLRKVMRQRLQLNSVQLNLLTLKKLDENEDAHTTLANTPKPNVELNNSTVKKQATSTQPQISPEKTLPTVQPAPTESQSNVQTPIKIKTNSTSNLFSLKPAFNKLTTSNSKVDLVTPKPFKKSTSTSNTITTSTAPLTTNQHTAEEMTTTNSLIEKQKSQMSFILNWTKNQQQPVSYCSKANISLTTNSSVSATQNIVTENSLSTSSCGLFHDDDNDFSVFDSLNEITNPTEELKNSVHVTPPTRATSPPSTEQDNSKLKNNDVHEDDLLDSLKLPPPVPVNAPPPLPNSKAKNKPEEVEIKKTLFENMKCVENWKSEQELLLKKKYEEGHKKIEISLKMDLEKVKEEENQRREQERLKLEKEKLRLQELELKQKEQELLKTSSELKSNSEKTGKSDYDEPSVTSSSESVKKEDLNALIEKLYTEEIEEKDMLTDYNSDSDYVQTSNPGNLSSRSMTKSPAIVMTKTSPIVAAALNLSEEEDFETIEERNSMSKKNEETRREIKQVHDSMDNLKNQLINKGMQKHADDVYSMKVKLKENGQKHQETESLKKEQETIKLEKEKIELEKERLRQEAEQLRIERELILLATQSKNVAAAVAATSGTVSSSTSSTSSANDQMDGDYSNATDQYTHIQQYKFLNQFTAGGGVKSIPIVFPRQENQSQKFANYQSVQKHQTSKPQSWANEEAERQCISKMSHNQVRNTEYHRRSVPNLLMEINNPTSSSQIYQQPGLNGSNQNITNQTSSSGMNRLYQKQQKKSKSPITIHNRHSSSQPKYQQASRQTFNNTPLSPNPYLSKPPTSKMSTSQSDLKNFVKHSQQKQTSNGHHPHHKLSTSTSNLVPNNNTGNCPVISLNQKCSCCSQMLGQGSAMFIEKLGLAFHLKCFRCSVCNVALGNGKEGTDVRVSVTNRLHCNNCFSNDLGVRLSAV